MKFTFQDEGGELYDFEAPEGTDKRYVLEQAMKQEGRKLKPFVADSKEGGKVLERLLDSERSARGRSDSDVTRLRARLDKMLEDHEGATRELTKASAAKLEAVAAGREAGAKLYAAEQALKVARDECATLKETCKELREEVKALKAVQPARPSYRGRITRRDDSGYMREFELEPK